MPLAFAAGLFKVKRLVPTLRSGAMLPGGGRMNQAANAGIEVIPHWRGLTDWTSAGLDGGPEDDHGGSAEAVAREGHAGDGVQSESRLRQVARGGWRIQRGKDRLQQE